MWRHALLLYALAAAAATASQPAPSSTQTTRDGTSHSASASLTSPVSSQASASRSTQTCENLSINYVTHRLPQQCLGRTSSPFTPSSVSSMTAAATAAASPSTSIDTITTATVIAERDSVELSGQSPKTAVSSSATSSLGSTSAPASVPSDKSSSKDTEEEEEESLLDNAKFLSFEDWKKQNLAEKGLPENVGQAGSPASAGREQRRPGINNALEGLGEDAEIDIDFSFGSHEPIRQADAIVTDASVQNAKDKPVAKRSKDAGKTCKQRFNYASFDCAANILKTNAKCKSASSVLVENKDSYMLNECSQENKFLIVELCDSVLIDTLVLANFEFFSSMFRGFRVSASDRYPVKPDKWVKLGTFEARNSRDIQPFLIESPPDTFARYLRIEFLSHFGSEYYCPLSLIRVHGITMFEQYRQSISTDNDDADEEDIAVQESGREVAAPILDIALDNKGQPSRAEPMFESKGESKMDRESTARVEYSQGASSVDAPVVKSVPLDGMPSTAAETGVCAASTRSHDILPTMLIETCIPSPVTSGPKSSSQIESVQSQTPTSSTVPQAEHNTPSAGSTQSNSTASMTSSKHSVVNPSEKSTIPSNSATRSASAVTAISKTTSTTTAMSVSSASASSSTVPLVSLTPQAPPPTQESFFKSVHNRLSLLEANSTLSLQYIESQSQLLREAFSKVEKRNAVTTSKFLDMLNSTVLAELARYKGEYEQIWQSTVLELASQRDEGRRERELLSERVSLLAEEMVAQKRLMAAQATLLLLCLGIVVFARFSTAGADSTLVQGVQELVSIRRDRRSGPKIEHKYGSSLSSGRRWPWESPWTSPPRSRDITRPQTSSGLAGVEQDPGMTDSPTDTQSLEPASPILQGGSGSDTDDAQGRGQQVQFSSIKNVADGDDYSSALHRDDDLAPSNLDEQNSHSSDSIDTTRTPMKLSWGLVNKSAPEVHLIRPQTMSAISQAQVSDMANRDSNMHQESIGVDGVQNDSNDSNDHYIDSRN